MLTRYRVVRNSFLWLVVLLTFLACEQDAEEILVPQPVADLRLINNDSLQALNTLIDSVGIVRDSLEELQANLVFDIEILNDSLDALQVGIDTGNFNLIQLREKVETTIEEKQNLRRTATDNLQVLLPLTTKYQSIISVINSGLVFVQAIRTTSLPGSITYEDSAALYSLPLNMNRQTTVFDIEIDNETYRLSLSYELLEKLNARGQVRLIVNSLGIEEVQNLDTAYIDEEGILIALF